MDSRSYVEALERMGRHEYAELAPYRVTVPTGKSGPWRVRRFETTYDLAYMRHVRDGRSPGLGKFTALNHESMGMVMSDTNAEIRDLQPYIHKLKGNVLVTGLGLGMVVHILTKAPECTKHTKSITIIEKDAHVIKLTGGHYRDSDKRIKIIHADAHEWEPAKGTKFDAAWHDIWNDISEDNRDDMKKIVRHYSKFVAAGNQHCWGRDTMDRLRRSDRLGW